MSVPPRVVLVPVDFGAASGRALAVGGLLASAFGARLVAVHAELLDLPPYFTPRQIDALGEERAAARAAAGEYLRRFAAEHTAYPVEDRIAEGTPVDVTLAAAGAADLIVMGTHGRRGPGRWWLGSVAERVVRAAAVPVLVVHDADAPAALFEQLLLVSADAAPYDSARDWASALAAVFQAEVVEAGPAGLCDPARLPDATLLVTAVPRGAADAAVPAVARLLRHCRKPILFVPVGREAGGV